MPFKIEKTYYKVVEEYFNTFRPSYSERVGTGKPVHYNLVHYKRDEVYYIYSRSSYKMYSCSRIHVSVCIE